VTPRLWREHYRALGLREGDIIAWFWIGTHEQYNRFHSEPAVIRKFSIQSGLNGKSRLSAFVLY
jgi:hypothetical protein